jgi:hypothetical protein
MCFPQHDVGEESYFPSCAITEVAKDERAENARWISGAESQVGEHQGSRRRQIGKEYLRESAGRGKSEDAEIVKLD